MNQDQNQPAQEAPKTNDKEINFRALEAKYQRELEKERREKEELRKQHEMALKAAQELQNRHNIDKDDEEDSDEYVNNKSLHKRLSNFEKQLESKFEKKAEEKARHLLKEEKQSLWLKSNPDFYEVMQHADKFAESNPDLAETILQMPEGFERQKLVYSTIKSMGINKAKEDSIQQKVDQNRKNPYYQPSGVANSPYGFQGDYSKQGQKSAYDKMKELQSRLRM